MRRVFVAVMIGGVLLAARAASAQFVPQFVPQAPKAADHGISIAGQGGVAAVQNVGPSAAGMLTFRLNTFVEAIGEGVWIKDSASRRRIEAAKTIATYLQTSQGKPASGTLEIPAVVAGFGVRVMLVPPGHVRPYFVVTGGIAKLAFKPAFVLSGADVTTNLTQYGVTLGSDLTGEISKPAYGGGVGVLVDQGRWYLDGALRVTSIQTEGQPTNVLRAGGGIGIRF